MEFGAALDKLDPYVDQFDNLADKALRRVRRYTVCRAGFHAYWPVWDPSRAGGTYDTHQVRCACCGKTESR